ncbi:hypothetical protein MASR1M31_03270 [Porphyromonadaceae bacterium]
MKPLFISKRKILTDRELQISEYIAWGSSVKEVASYLEISVKTVDNHLQNIYRKTGCGKLNELSAWFFCNTYHIPMEMSPLRRTIITLILMMILLPWQVISNDTVRQSQRTSTRSSRSRREESIEQNYYLA